MKKYVDDLPPSFSFPKQIAEEYSGKIYEGEEGKKKIMKAIFDETLAEFEKDLRSVQRDVLEHWESAKHWWEKWYFAIPATVGGLLSLISAVVAVMVAIVRWLMQFEWVKSLFG